MRIVKTVMAVMSAVVLVCAVPATAVADVGVASPDWLTEYKQDTNAVGVLIPDESGMFSNYLITCAAKNCNPATDTTTTLAKAIKNGNSTYYSGGTEYKVSDAQSAVAKAKHSVVKKHYVKADGSYYSKSDVKRILRQRQTRLSQTSSQISAAEKTTGQSAATVIASAQTQDADMIEALNALDTSQGIKDSIKKGLKSSLAVIGAVSDVADALNLGVTVGNGVVQLFNIDQAAECESVTNGIARLALGISDICSSYDDSFVPTVGATSYTFDGTGYYSFDIYLAFNDYLSTPVRVYPTSMSPTHFVGRIVNPNDVDITFLSRVNPGYNKVSFKIPTESSSYYFYCPSLANADSFGCGLDFTIKAHESIDVDWSFARSFYNSYTDCSGVKTGMAACNAAFPKSWTLYHDDGSSFETSGSAAAGDASPTVSVTGSDGKTYTSKGDSQSQGGLVVLPAVDLPSGVTPLSLEVTKTANGSTETIVPKTQLQVDTNLNGALDLIDVATGTSCYLEANACADWATQVQTSTGTAVSLDNKTTTETVGETQTLPYKCVYETSTGTTELGIGECTALKNAFSKTATATGETATDPDTGEQITTKTETEADTSPSYADCVTDSVSWNPVSWVTVPVKCALSWAFEPDSDNTTTQTVLVKQAAHNSMATGLQSAFESAIPSTSDATQCQGPEFNLTAFGYTLFDHSHPLSVCEGSGLGFLPTFVKAGLTVLIGIIAIMTVRRHLSNVVGLNDQGNGES